jgi:hypothetical protein
MRLRVQTPAAAKNTFKKLKISHALMTNAYKPSYLGGRDQEDQGSKSALGK